MSPPNVVVFDLGGVLIDWNPRRLYRKMFADEATMERFLEEIGFDAWNQRQDAGRPFAEAVAEASAAWPQHRPYIEAYQTRWEEMLGGPIPGSVAILESLAAAGRALHAITNWSAESFVAARRLYPFLKRFETILVSGEERLIKPDPAIFRLFLDRTGLEAAACVFVDDSPKNVAAAAALGFDAIRFETPAGLAAALARRGFETPAPETLEDQAGAAAMSDKLTANGS